jgi:hypothetical protein
MGLFFSGGTTTACFAVFAESLEDFFSDPDNEDDCAVTIAQRHSSHPSAVNRVESINRLSG